MSVIAALSTSLQPRSQHGPHVTPLMNSCVRKPAWLTFTFVYYLPCRLGIQRSAFLLLALQFMAARDLAENILETRVRICKQASLILVGVGFLQALLVGVRHDSTENKQVFQQCKCLSPFQSVFLGQRPGLWAQSTAELRSRSWVSASPARALLPLPRWFAPCGAEHSRCCARAVCATCSCALKSAVLVHLMGSFYSLSARPFALASIVMVTSEEPILQPVLTGGALGLLLG